MSLLSEPDAFYTEHEGCGELDDRVDDSVFWMACECGARIVRSMEAEERA